MKKRLSSAIIMLAGCVTILNFLIDKYSWLLAWGSFFKDWLPWIAVVMNLAALIVLRYLWINLQALKKEAIERQEGIKKLDANFTLKRSDLDGPSKKT